MKHYCAAPFTHISIDPRGVLLPCCRYKKPLSNLDEERIDEGWNNQNFQDLRNQFLNGEKPEACSDCWHAEESGNQSLRSVINGWARNKKFDSAIVDEGPVYYEFKTTNVCNLKCRMCGSFNSSQIAKETESIETRKHYLKHKLIGTHHEPIIYEWLKKADYILFAGGEPFVNEEIKKVMTYIDEQNLNAIRTLMVTNGTYWNEKFVSQLKSLLDLDIRISLDDIYERNDYQREGSDFNIIEQNFIKFSKNFYGKVTFNCTLNWYNIYHIDEFLEYADDFNTPVSIQYVENPPYLNISNLPIAVKEIVCNKFKDTKDERIKKIIRRMMIDGEDQLNKFWKHINYYDKLRGNDFRVAFPEWSKVLESV